MAKVNFYFLNSEREQEIVVKLIMDFKNLISTDKENLQQQLQAYKDKEDKLRELIDNYIHDDFGELCLDDILQILNEGDK